MGSLIRHIGSGPIMRSGSCISMSGGAQAIAGMAYGTETITKVQKSWDGEISGWPQPSN